MGTVTVSTTSLGSSVGATYTPTESTNRTIFVHGTFTDLNGCELADNVTLWTLSLYRSGVATSNNECTTASAYSCYQANEPANVAITSCSGATDTVGTYEWTLSSLVYYADPTDTGTYSAQNWIPHVRIVDDSSSAVESTASTFEIATLASIDVSSSITYGSVAVGANSSQQTATVWHMGNKGAMDAFVKVGGDMTCTTGTVAAGQVRYSLTTGFTYASGTAMTTTDANIDLNMTAGSSGTAQSSVYLMLNLPSAGGYSGTCTNTATFTAN
jgi:hypothetical protein